MTIDRRGAIASSILVTGTGPSEPVPYVLSELSGVPSRVIFDDEFDADALNTTIWTPHWYTPTQNNTPMDASNVTMSGTGAELTLATNNTGAIITTNPNDGVAGHTGYWVPSPTAEFPVYVEWSFSCPAVSGVIANWPSVWLEGVDQDWPTQGEIDIMEGIGGQAGWHTHWGATDGVDEGGEGAFESGSFTGSHIYGALWSTTAVTFVYDGEIVGVHTFTAGTETTAMNFPKMLNAENALSYSGATEYPLTPATAIVDYCRVWQNTTVVSTLALNSIPTQSGTVGVAISSISPVASGGTTPYAWSMSGEPSGISINANSGVITGDPTESGNYEVTVTVTDHVGDTAQTTFAFDIAAAGSMVISAISNINATVGIPITSVTFHATGGVTPYKWFDSGLPTGINLNQNTGVMSGTPTQAFDSVVQITVADSTTPTPLQGVNYFTFVVTGGSGNPVPDAPATIDGITVPQTLVFRDEFTEGAVNHTYWNTVTDGTVDNEAAMQASNVTFNSDGLVLAWNLVDGQAQGSLITTNPRFNNPSGEDNITGSGFTFTPSGGGTLDFTGPIYIEFSATFTVYEGQIANWPALWVAGGAYPDGGEIDIQEGLGGTLATTTHYDDYSQSDRAGSTSLSQGTFGMLWTASGQYIVNNGSFVYSSSIPMSELGGTTYPYGILLENGGGLRVDYYGGPIDSGAIVTIRYVRVWAG